jgi:hypothetical protein
LFKELSERELDEAEGVVFKLIFNEFSEGEPLEFKGIAIS